MSKRWYSFKSKDNKSRGCCPAKNKSEVAGFAGYPVEQLTIKRVEWNGEEFVNSKQSRVKEEWRWPIRA